MLGMDWREPCWTSKEHLSPSPPGASVYRFPVHDPVSSSFPLQAPSPAHGCGHSWIIVNGADVKAELSYSASIAPLVCVCCVAGASHSSFLALNQLDFFQSSFSCCM